MDKNDIIDSLLSKEKIICKDSFTDDCVSAILIEENLNNKKILLTPQFTQNVVEKISLHNRIKRIKIWSYSIIATAALFAIAFTFTFSPNNKLPSDDLILLAIQDEMISNMKFALDTAQITQLNNDIDTLTASLVEQYALF